MDEYDDDIGPHIITNDIREPISIITCIVIATFSLSSWIAINGIWVELPNLIYELPEHFKLPSYITVLCQVGNIGCIIYVLLTRCCKRLEKKKIEHYTIIFMLFLGALACIMLGMFWDETIFIGDKEISFAFLFLVFVVSLVDCTSSVTYLPFMAIFPSVYISSLYVGETIGTFIPSVIALVQGPYRQNQTNGTLCADPDNGLLFPQSTFFICLSLLMLASLLGYISLYYIPFFKRQHAESPTYFGFSVTDLLYENGTSVSTNNNKKQILYYLFLLALICFQQNGVVSSISSYAFAHYGSLAYHLVATLGPIFAALSCILYMYLPIKSTLGITILTLLYTLSTGVILVMALQSPNPFLKGQKIGEAVAILISILSSSLAAYTKLSITCIMREEGKTYLFYSGISFQVGSFLGSILMFPIVNYANVFKS